ncbi:MAG: hypothetical protein KC910_09255, partial [Candidatus Eremiobacteraeota bacterium]|nr:hypothetical protein [Candidatus Eremiobacteraeota bacterium]
NFLDSFKQAWGLDPDRNPQTIRGLLALGRHCLEHPEFEPDLTRAAERLASRVTDIYQQGQCELEQAQRVDPELMEHLLGSQQAYQEILEALAQLAPPLDELDETLENLEAGADLLAAHQRVILAWNDQAACPACGSHGKPGQLCGPCQAYRVYQDPNPPDIPAVELGDAYFDLHQACRGLATGQANLAALEGAIETLASALWQINNLARRNPGQAGLRQALAESFEGLDRLGQFTNSFAVADLNAGWLVVSQAGLKLESLSLQAGQ